MKRDGLVWAVVVAGAAVRLASYLKVPSLSIDDAMLSYNVLSRSFIGLAHPLELQQTAPVGFLWALRASALVGGVNELALRFLPLLAGVVLPYAVWRLARRVLSPGLALVAAGFVALSPILIQYSVSVKPYETDALLATVLGSLTLTVAEAPSLRSWVRLGAGGVLAIACSTPAVFVLAGCGVALLVVLGRRALGPLAAVGGAWVTLFVLIYLAVARAEATSPYMQWFWEQKFLTPAVLLGHPGAAWGLVQRLPTQVFTADAPRVVALALCWLAGVAGLLHLSRTSGGKTWVFAGPVGAALLASLVRRYPVSPRLFVFAAPLVAVMLAAGIDFAVRQWTARIPRAALVTAVSLWVLALAVLSANVSRLWPPATRPLVAQVERERVDHEPLYVYAGAVPAWLFYGIGWSDSTERVLARTVAAAERWDAHAFVNAPSRGHAVVDTEGAHLTFVQRGFPVVIGLSSGVTWREGAGQPAADPDSGWADREASRIVTATDSTAWLLFSQLSGREMPILLHALALRHGTAVLSQSGRGAFLYRVRFSCTRCR